MQWGLLSLPSGFKYNRPIIGSNSQVLQQPIAWAKRQQSMGNKMGRVWSGEPVGFAGPNKHPRVPCTRHGICVRVCIQNHRFNWWFTAFNVWCSIFSFRSLYTSEMHFVETRYWTDVSQRLVSSDPKLTQSFFRNCKTQSFNFLVNIWTHAFAGNLTFIHFFRVSILCV